MSAADRTDFDSELQRHNEVLRRAAAIRTDDHVLDIGCGTGHTTRQAATTARAGTALGVDISGPAIEDARRRAQAAKLHNVSFEQADAQTHRFPSSHFDVALSRFGTMFFDDPVAAFGNIGRAIRPAGRLIMMVWQSRERNEWIAAITDALRGSEHPAINTVEDPDPFSLADPPATTEILEAAGFSDTTFTDVNEPVFYGSTVTAAFEWIRGFTCTNRALTALSSTDAEATVERLYAVLAARATDNGIWFDSRAWIISARRRAAAP